MATTINPALQSRSYKTLYWLAAVAVIAIGIAYSISISRHIEYNAAHGVNSSELNYQNGKRTPSDPTMNTK